MRLNSFLDHLPAGSTLADSKDRLISARIKQEVNVQLARYGEVLDVKLNTREQSVEISVRLKGEPNPIRQRSERGRSLTLSKRLNDRIIAEVL